MPLVAIWMEQVCGAEALLVAMVRVLCAYPTVELAKRPLLHGIAGETWIPAPAGAGVGLVVMARGTSREIPRPLLTPTPSATRTFVLGAFRTVNRPKFDGDRAISSTYGKP